jgi:hypothetical protein
VATISGGAKLQAALAEMAQMVSKPATLRVGFLEKATYPDGKPVAMIAAIQEFGAPSVGIPPRPFFRNMIAKKSPQWPLAIKNLLVQNNYDAEKALDITGAAIAGQLRQSVIDTNAPPLKPATIRRKGFAKPLIDTSVMINSIDHEVKT